MGFALRLIYRLDGTSTRFFSSLLMVPPKKDVFGVRTQFSCPLDSFLFINDDHKMEAISIVSACLGLHLGSFPIAGLVTHIYIFNECKLSTLCSTLDSTHVNLLVWSTFPDDVPVIELGHFLELFSQPKSNRTGLFATFSRKDHEFEVRLLSLRAFLFNVSFETVATIDKEQLTFTENVKLYNKFPASLKASIQQTSDWENIEIQVQGKFLNKQGNIPQLLCKEISNYIEGLYTRSQSRIKNSKAAYDRAKLLHINADSTYKTAEATMFAANELVRQTEQELGEIKNTVLMLSIELQKGDASVKSLKDEIEGLCNITKCPGICIPQENCSECKHNISSLIQSTCRVTSVKRQNVSVLTGHEIRYKPEVVSYLKCPNIVSCKLLPCLSKKHCHTEYFSMSVPYKSPVYEIKERTENTSRIEPCKDLIIHTSVSAMCCRHIECADTQQSIDCLQRNQQCKSTRDVLYLNLDEEKSNNTDLIRSLDEAKANETATNLRLERYKLRYQLSERQFNQSKAALNDANDTLDIAASSYKKIRQENQVDVLEGLSNISICSFSDPSYISIKSVIFVTKIITESPKTLALSVELKIPSARKAKRETVVYLDFFRLNASLKQAASTIASEIIFKKKVGSKDQKRNVRNLSPEDENYVHFQSQCSDLKNILTYFEELRKSINTIATTVQSSLLRLSSNMLDISSLINYTTSNILGGNAIGGNATFDLQFVALLTNKTLSDLDTDVDNVESQEISEVLKLMEEHLLDGQQIANSLNNNLFQSWQAKTEFLHNYTKSAAGFPCFGFTDCLQEVVLKLHKLIAEVPQTNVENTSTFTSAVQDLLDLAILQNYSIISAQRKVDGIYKLASDLVLRNYWCAGPPIIKSIQPSNRVNPRENTAVVLSCEVDDKKYTFYQWRKDCIELPNKQNNELLLTNLKLSDSGNYTCVVTNHVSSVTSANILVEVQQPPSFFLQPKNIDEFLGNQNGAIIKSNATGFPYPSYRWYFQPKGAKGFIHLPGENQNELSIVPPLPEHEGSYYCEAYNEQGVTRSKVVNLTVLQSAVVQVAQTVYVNFTFLNELEKTKSFGSGSILTIPEIEFSGSGDTSTRFKSFLNEFSGSGENQDKMPGSGNDANITITPSTKLVLEKSLMNVLNVLISFKSTSVQNVTFQSTSSFNLVTSFTLYSKSIDYSDTPLLDINQLAPLARLEWAAVWNELKEVLSVSGFIISDDNYEYESDASSLRFDILQFLCSPGKEISPVNNLLCGK